MTRNGYPRVIHLEFKYIPTGICPAAMGTDSIMHIDGRLHRGNVHVDICVKARSIIARKGGNYELAGYSIPGDSANTIREFPEIVLIAANEKG